VPESEDTGCGDDAPMTAEDAIPRILTYANKRDFFRYDAATALSVSSRTLSRGSFF
jgi:hypothetical protein